MIEVNIAQEFLKCIPIEYEVGGSILRGNKEQVKDIDILVNKKDLDFWKELDLCMKEVKIDGIDRALVIFEFKHGSVDYDIPLDIFYCTDKEKPCFRTYLAGNKVFNIVLRSLAKKKGYTLNQRCLIDKQNNEEIFFDSEEELFNFLGLKFIPYREREVMDFSDGHKLLNKYRMR